MINLVDRQILGLMLAFSKDLLLHAKSLLSLPAMEEVKKFTRFSLWKQVLWMQLQN
jgi:hypothetical protein